jgi:hypothetical protein
MHPSLPPFPPCTLVTRLRLRWIPHSSTGPKQEFRSIFHEIADGGHNRTDELHAYFPNSLCNTVLVSSSLDLCPMYSQEKLSNGRRRYVHMKFNIRIHYIYSLPESNSAILLKLTTP